MPLHVTVVGRLTQQGIRKCVKDGTVWVHPHYEVGFIWVEIDPSKAKPLLGQLVVVEGERMVRPSLPKVKHEAPCIEAQMRSDWEWGMSGMRLRRDNPNRIPAMRVTRLRPFQGLRLTRSGDLLRVEFKNEFPHNLHGVSILVHYEGCYGKPGSLAKTVTLGTLSSGETARSTFPVTAERPESPRWRRMHSANSLQVMTRQALVVFDFDWSLGREKNLQIECPKKPRPSKDWRAGER
jgi:hypothetical protein